MAGFGTRIGRDAPLYGVLFVVWSMVMLALGALVYVYETQAFKTRFQHDAELATLAIRERLLGNETLLRGFAAFLRTAGPLSHAQLGQYAEEVLAGTPEVYLEVAETVSDGERDRFERAMSAHYGGSQRIRHFDYDHSFSWSVAPEARLHHPISFVWPLNARTRELIGLDMHVVPNGESIQADARLRGQAAMIPPFQLAVGGRGYVLIEPTAIVSRWRDDAAPRAAYAQLLVRSTALAPDVVHPRLSVALTIVREGVELAPLFAIRETTSASAWERMLLPREEVETNDFSTIQPIGLVIGRQMVFDDVGVGPVGLWAAVFVTSLGVLLAYVVSHNRKTVRAEDALTRAEFEALHDPLTGLANPRLMWDRVDQAIANWRRNKLRFALLFIDVDRFKSINDTYGHAAGDAVLKAVADRLQGSVREVDTVARIAGDEFVVVLSGVGSDEDAARAAAKIRDAVAVPVALDDGKDCMPQVSVGTATFPDDGSDAHTLLRHADREMYRAKRA